MKHFDVLVVGGGPAGSMAAAGVLKANPQAVVGLVDPDSDVSHRIGEALLTGTIMSLQDAGLDGAVADAGFHHKVGAAYVWGESREPWYVNYPRLDDDAYPVRFKDTTGYRRSIHVARDKFDPILRREVEKRGVEIVRSKIRTVKTTDTKDGPAIVSVVTDGGETITAKRFIDASGHAHALARHVTKRQAVGAPRIARYAYTPAVDWAMAERCGFDAHRTNIVSNANGWFWAIHLGEAGDGLTSLGFVSTPEIASKLTFDNCTGAFPELKAFGFKDGYLAPSTFDGVPAAAFYGHPDYSFACERLHGANWSLSGDAAMFIDPILSQGVTLAVHYGFGRGLAAAAELHGDATAQEKVTENYRREGAILRLVVGEWYGNNRAVDDWRMKSVMVSKDLFGEDLDPVTAFRYVTNLENLRHDYDPYPEEERRHIWKKLGVAPSAL
ncbi:NAD(P)/FAD-dependent oxidoreductase [Rhizobium leguminosarum]|uniref:NAD(P)/FAD-dependent oxidoreductase n=1 Tax=Rhizobium leguminosarum TaxID=384 RepID=UPI002E0F5FF8|nr:tryptophan 7-halogenase [Rhizobium leguminosarum]WSH77883.1 tryptophan 7-halogenase [Rhizobium leguminosarum]